MRFQYNHRCQECQPLIASDTTFVYISSSGRYLHTGQSIFPPQKGSYRRSPPFSQITTTFTSGRIIAQTMGIKATKQAGALLISLALTLQLQDAFSQDTENIDNLQQVYARALAHYANPKLQERKELLRSYQQTGYANVLMLVLDGDGFGALISYIRTRLQIDFSLPHDLITVDITSLPPSHPQTDHTPFAPRTEFRIILPQVPTQRTRIGLDIDWTFPEDPWKRD